MKHKMTEHITFQPKFHSTIEEEINNIDDTLAMYIEINDKVAVSQW